MCFCGRTTPETRFNCIEIALFVLFIIWIVLAGGVVIYFVSPKIFHEIPFSSSIIAQVIVGFFAIFLFLLLIVTIPYYCIAGCRHNALLNAIKPFRQHNLLCEIETLTNVVYDLVIKDIDKSWPKVMAFRGGNYAGSFIAIRTSHGFVV